MVVFGGTTGDAIYNTDLQLMRLPATFVLAPDIIYALIHAVAATISYRNPAAVLELVARRLERHSAVH